MNRQTSSYENEEHENDEGDDGDDGEQNKNAEIERRNPERDVERNVEKEEKKTTLVVTPLSSGAAFPKMQSVVLDLLHSVMQELHTASLQTVINDGKFVYRDCWMTPTMMSKMSEHEIDQCIVEAQSGNALTLWRQGRYPGLKWPEKVYDATSMKKGKLMFHSGGNQPLSEWMQFASPTKYIELSCSLFHLRSVFGCSLDPSDVVKLMPLKISPEALHVTGFPAKCPFTHVGIELGVQIGDRFDKWTNQTEVAWLLPFSAGTQKKDLGTLIVGKIASDIKRPDPQQQQPMFAKIVPITTGASIEYTSASAFFLANPPVWERSGDERFWATVDIHDDKFIAKYAVVETDGKGVILRFTETTPGCIDNPLVVWLLNKQHVHGGRPDVQIKCIDEARHMYVLGPLDNTWFRQLVANLRTRYKAPVLIPLDTGLGGGKLVLRLHPLVTGGKDAVKNWQHACLLSSQPKTFYDPDVSFALTLDVVTYS